LHIGAALPLFRTKIEEQDIRWIAGETLGGKFEVRDVRNMKLAGIFRVQQPAKPACILRFAHQCIGVDPVEAMLKWASTTASSAHFVAGAAEAIPLCDRAVDLITAAGSLNYTNLDLFFPEALRVLMPHGVLVVYDFSPGTSFRNATGLEEWFSNFADRYPLPPDEARTLNPEILAELDSGFRLHGQRYFEIEMTMTPDFYLDYMMTETNVAAARRRGVLRSEIRSWCTETLAPVWRGKERGVLFRGYFACLTPA